MTIKGCHHHDGTPGKQGGNAHQAQNEYHKDELEGNVYILVKNRSGVIVYFHDITRKE